jgi:hypothetical protein
VLIIFYTKLSGWYKTYRLAYDLDLVVQQTMENEIYYAVSMLYMVWGFDVYDLVDIALFQFKYFMIFNGYSYISA